MSLRRSLLVLGSVSLLFWIGACQTRSLDLAKLSRADHAEVRSNHDELPATLDREKTKYLAELLAHESHGWEVPWYGTPVAKVAIRFLEGEQSLGTIGIGQSFLTAGPAQELSKDMPESRCAVLLVAAGVRQDDPP